MSNNLFSSTIGRKLIMSISGLFLILFLLFHMAMNMVAIFSLEAYNAVCHFLGTNWYALAGTAVLAAGFLFHIAYAFILTRRNMVARGKERYSEQKRSGNVSWASRNMFVLGVIIVLGLVLHLCHFWYKMQFAELIGAHIGQYDWADGANYLLSVFGNPVMVVLYLVWFAAFWYHLTHGFWSAFHTLGWNNQVWLNRWKCIATIFATIIFLGFAAVAIAMYFKANCPTCF
jgi:succinate dehydrogenase / fumarate reductase cytochrome b subunit